MPDEKILDKLGKIKAHMESAKAMGSEAEAEAFAGMLNNLLTKYKLEMTDIQYSDHVKEEPVESYWIGGGVDYEKPWHPKAKRVYKNYPDVECPRRRNENCERLAQVLAGYHQCGVMVAERTAAICFVGRKSNVMIVEYLYITMLRVSTTLADKEYKLLRGRLRREAEKLFPGNKNTLQTLLVKSHGYHQSFMEGFIGRIHRRLEEERQKMFDGASTALVRLSSDALAVSEFMKGANKARELPQGNSRFNALGYTRGKEVADGLNIKANAVESTSREERRLK